MGSALTDRGGTRRWRKIRARILDRDGHRCSYCGGPADQVDHILARANGGGDDEDNLTACCKTCNLARGDRGSRSGAHVTVVTGPQGAGKTTYVADHAQPGDIVVDFDTLAQAFGSTSRHDHPDSTRWVTYEAWTAAVRRLWRVTDRACWLIHAHPALPALAEYRARGARLIVMDYATRTPASTGADPQGPGGDGFRSGSGHPPALVRVSLSPAGTPGGRTGSKSAGFADSQSRAAQPGLWSA